MGQGRGGSGWAAGGGLAICTRGEWRHRMGTDMATESTMMLSAPANVCTGG